MKLCCALNLEKLSAEACVHLSQNKKFPSKSAVQALISQKLKLKSLLHGVDNTKSYTDLPCGVLQVGKKKEKEEADEQVVLYAGKLGPSADNEDLRANLRGMQCRVLELEKICRKMQVQMTKIMKSKVPGNNHTRSLPRLCS